MKPSRDAGFTLPELLICVVLMGLLTTVLSMAIVMSLRTAPGVSDRADAAIAVQGITTWLPPDADSVEPGGFDIDPATPSGCSSGGEGQNIVRMQWHEAFAGATTTFVANYRFVSDGTTARIQRVACSGQSSLGAGNVQSMSAALSPTTPTVTLYDGDGDGHDDQLEISVTTRAGETFLIRSASKNPGDTLPPSITNPTTTLAATTTTTTTTLPNQAPTALATSALVNPDITTNITLNGTDPENGALTASVESLPVGWSAPTSGLVAALNPGAAAPGTYELSFTVTDPLGATSSAATLTVEVTTAATTTSTTSTTTTTTSTTTTTTLPPCVVSGVSVSRPSVKIQGKGQGLLQHDVTVTATISGGYCVGLTLQYDTGAPNGQYIQNFSAGEPHQVRLIGHPSGTELWSEGIHTLFVRDGFDNLLGQVNLEVTE